MTAVFAPVRAARLAWQRTQPQLFIDFEELPDAVGTSVPASPLTGRRPAAPTGPRTAGRASHHAHLPADRAHGGPGRGSALNTNAVGSQDSRRVTREPTAEGV